MYAADKSAGTSIGTGRAAHLMLLHAGSLCPNCRFQWYSPLHHISSWHHRV